MVITIENYTIKVKANVKNEILLSLKSDDVIVNRNMSISELEKLISDLKLIHTLVDKKIGSKYKFNELVSVNFVDEKGDFESKEIGKIKDSWFDEKDQRWHYNINFNDPTIDSYNFHEDDIDSFSYDFLLKTK